MVYQYSENFILPISHDEVVHGKGSMINKIPGDDWQQFASLRAFYSYMWSFPGKQLIFMGQEFGQRHEFDESASLEWFVADLWGHGGLKRLFRDLNMIYKENPALWQLDSDPRGFEWINADDAGNNLFSWLRRVYQHVQPQPFRLDDRLLHELLPQPADRLPRRTTRGRRVDRDPQHRFLGVRRNGRVRKPRPGRGHPASSSRSLPGRRHRVRPADGLGVAAPRSLGNRCSARRSGNAVTLARRIVRGR